MLAAAPSTSVALVVTRSATAGFIHMEQPQRGALFAIIKIIAGAYLIWIGYNLVGSNELSESDGFMKYVIILLLAGLSLFGCAGERLVTKPWHTSPSPDPRSSTCYPFVSWPVVQQLHPGMSTADARRLIFTLQTYHHPVNAIVYSNRDGENFEIALQLSSDGKQVKDISYKKVAKIANPAAAD